MSYDPYSAYKDSGVPWLGQVPKGWETSRVDFQCTVKARLGWKGLTASEYVDEGYVFLATPNIKGNKIDYENVNYINEQRYLESPEIMIEPGDVLLAKDGSTLGTTNYVRALPRPATVNSSIAIVRPRRNNVDGAFLYRWIESDVIQSKIQQMKDGQGVPHLFQSDIRKFPLPLPPIEEQTAIADFLDEKTAEIDDLIAKKEELVRLLAEQRTALIAHAVTKGLNPNAPMKPSGIDWLDEMPPYWVNPRVQHIVQLRSGEAITSERIADAGDFPVYGGNGFRGYTDRYTHKGDFVLVGRQGALCGNINYASGKFWASEHALVANPLREFDVDWMGELLRAMNLNQYSVSAAQPGLSVDNIAKLRIPLPPIEEQSEIAAYIKQETLKISNIEKAVEKAIKKLRKYRTALITNAVTGKFKVA